MGVTQAAVSVAGGWWGGLEVGTVMAGAVARVAVWGKGREQWIWAGNLGTAPGHTSQSDP